MAPAPSDISDIDNQNTDDIRLRGKIEPSSKERVRTFEQAMAERIQNRKERAERWLKQYSIITYACMFTVVFLQEPLNIDPLVAIAFILGSAGFRMTEILKQLTKITTTD